MSDETPLISIVVCTHNRADLLADLLPTICEQIVSDLAYEVIIVDNNSSDKTPIVGGDFAARFSHTRYLVEPQQGLSHARNRGWQAARGRYVGYIDDDCRVPEGWLAVAADIVQSVEPTAFGGPYFAFFNQPKPAWFKETYESHVPYSIAQFIDEPDKLHGGNLFVQRDALAIVGGFDPSFGMKGEKIAYGEESMLLERIRQRLPTSTFYYNPALFIYHLVRPEKLAWHRIVRQRFNNGCAAYQVYHQGSPVQSKWEAWLSIGKKSAHICYSATLGLLLRERTRFPDMQNYLYEETARHIITLGWCWAQCQHIHIGGNKADGALDA